MPARWLQVLALTLIGAISLAAQCSANCTDCTPSPVPNAHHCHGNSQNTGHPGAACPHQHPPLFSPESAPNLLKLGQQSILPFIPASVSLQWVSLSAEGAFWIEP